MCPTAQARGFHRVQTTSLYPAVDIYFPIQKGKKTVSETISNPKRNLLFQLAVYSVRVL